MAIKQNGLTSIDDVLANDDAAIVTLTHIDGFFKVENEGKKKPTMRQTLLPGIVTQVRTLRQM